MNIRPRYFLSFISIALAASPFHSAIAQAPSFYSSSQNAAAPVEQTSVVRFKKTKEEKFTAEWRFKMGGSSFSDQQSQSNYVDFLLDLRTKYNLTSTLQLDIQPSVRLVSGQSQTIDGADKMENKLLLNQAAAHYNFLDYFRLSTGALNQRFMHSSLLMDEMAFPASRALGLFKADQFETAFAVETAIPTSTSLSTNTKQLEATPSLNTGAIIIKWSDKETTWKSNLGYFMYNNLPSAVAQQSMLLGNTVSNISDAQYTFVYKYQGVEASTDLQFPLSRKLDLLAQAEYLKNIKTSEQNSTASKYLVGTNIHLGSGIDWTIKGGYYAIAPDAAVAYFNFRGYETNRVGYTAETSLAFKPDNFKIGIQYKEAELMYTNPVQTREKSLMLRLETFYAKL